MGPYAVGFISICLVVHPQEIVKGFSFWQKNIRPAVPDMCPPTVLFFQIFLLTRPYENSREIFFKGPPIKPPVKKKFSLKPKTNSIEQWNRGCCFSEHFSILQIVEICPVQIEKRLRRSLLKLRVSKVSGFYACRNL